MNHTLSRAACVASVDRNTKIEHKSQKGNFHKLNNKHGNKKTSQWNVWYTLIKLIESLVHCEANNANNDGQQQQQPTKQ